eukprot:CAMPEP_0170525730 /NCGR_PEP_ID=MMETSP0209-20121228/11180_1 /TAXON_ID=665100 ORGANISM="Litonotus pictus, Strain P1" /NCGR_SAMPLE_ID=MMETSP0209 /ASSEMBLY_ACC=CAM_ASM_000301 /LENGTH=242 /DNA_ID=CAMNT_0010815141 /DNA_START=325 /DNA_END=1053 /DNA_ORIENTATION=-
MPNEFNIKQEDGTVVSKCSTMLSCILVYFNQGVRHGGGIGDILKPKSYSSKNYLEYLQYIINKDFANVNTLSNTDLISLSKNLEKAAYYNSNANADIQLGMGSYWVRTLHDVLFFIIIILLVVNMFSGIIIETFGTLREENEEHDYNMKNKCFVCNVDRIDFLKRSINFEAHTEIDHNLKDLLMILFSMKMLDNEDSLELDYLERYIINCVKQRSYECFPIKMLPGRVNNQIYEEVKDEEEG